MCAHRTYHAIGKEFPLLAHSQSAADAFLNSITQAANTVLSRMQSWHSWQSSHTEPYVSPHVFPSRVSQANYNFRDAPRQLAAFRRRHFYAEDTAKRPVQG